MLVDDDESYHCTIGECLTQKGALITSVVSIRDAKKALLTESFDLVILDSFLLDGMGLFVLDFMKLEQLSIPVIMITVDEDQESMKQYFLKGISNYLLKPVNLELLGLLVQRALCTHLNEQKLQRQFQELELMLNERKEEEKLARYVFQHLSQSFSKPPEAINSFMRSSKSFNGDFFVAENLPNGNTLLFMMDAAGHGLASAITILPAVSTMRAMMLKGMSMRNIVYEINDKLCAEIPDERFVAMIAVEIKYHQGTIDIINAGMPELLIIDDNSEIIYKVRSQSLPLGIVGRNDFSPFVNEIPLKNNQHLFFYSDGLIEQRCCAGVEFGKSSLNEIIKNNDDAASLLNKVIERFSMHCANTAQEDDVSICCVSLDQLRALFNGKTTIHDKLNQGHIHLELDFAGDLLSAGNMVSVIDDVLNRIGLNTELKQKAFTVFSELISNALDHGVLRLDSSLKHDFNSFGQYIEQRTCRLKYLEQDDRIRLTLGFEPEIGQLYFDIEDSGTGYDRLTHKAIENEALFGRGLNLVEKLCEQIQVIAPGNRTSVLIK
ncbi:MAG: fused response regulator/phosphatase [Paraglaciecola polaris]|uniref:ATP-binding SpoIIE family protein phosphatase n=1 Tax=Paraglaciecola polaris TaxID=222814 RepID=UPI00300389EE